MHRVSFLALAALAATAAPALAWPTGSMTWDRQHLRPGVDIAGYDVAPGGRSLAAAICHEKATCVIAVREGEATPKAYRPPDDTAWREPRFENGESLLLVASPVDRRRWSSQRSAIVRLDLTTGTARTLHEGRYISSVTPIRGGFCFSEATEILILPAARKPVKFAIRCVDGGGEARSLGTVVFDAVADLAYEGREHGLVFNGVASSYGGETPAFLRRTSDGPAANMLARIDLKTGVVTEPRSPAAVGRQWFAGQGAGQDLLIGYGAEPGRRKRRELATSWIVQPYATHSSPVAVADVYPGVVRPGGDQRGLLLLDDLSRPAGFADLGWIDLLSGKATRDVALTDALVAASKPPR